MCEINCDVAVIGAGPAGLAAACAAKAAGAGKVLVIERDTAPGGILQQCIHAGFGLKYFGRELTGPEYAGRFAEKARAAGVEFLPDTMVLSIEAGGRLACLNPTGPVRVQGKAVVLSMGCRERTRGSIAIPGTRPAGVFTAGTAQRMMNLQNEMVGREVVILGSGDIGMIMARRLTLEGARVAAVVELLPYLSGLVRNKVQCLDDFDIPLYLSHTVTRVEGMPRVGGAAVARVDENRRPIPNTERLIPCDTLLLSVGLIPENELSRAAGIQMDPVTGGPVVDSFMQTSAPGVFACGNVLHVNDLVDQVSYESELAGHSAALHAAGRLPAGGRLVPTQAGENVRYLCPAAVNTAGGGAVTLYFRVAAPARNVRVRVYSGGRLLQDRPAPRVSPGEMEQVRVDAGDIAAGPLRVEVAAEMGGEKGA